MIFSEVLDDQVDPTAVERANVKKAELLWSFRVWSHPAKVAMHRDVAYVPFQRFHKGWLPRSLAMLRASCMLMLYCFFFSFVSFFFFFFFFFFCFFVLFF